MRYFTFKGSLDGATPNSDVTLNDGTPIVLSRTGYTGEFGFEIFVGSGDLPRTWDSIVSAGRTYGLIPCGLAARDALRAGAVLPLSHQDIGPWPFINNPWEFALPFNADKTAFTKSFIGDVVLSKRQTADHTHAFVGFDPRKVSVHDPAVVLDSGGREIGTVLTCVADMAIGRHEGRIYSIASPDKPEGFNPGGLVCGFVKVNVRLHSGDPVRLRDKRREIKVTIADDIRPDRTARRDMAVSMNVRR
jgi:aminomethyltransferase